MDANRKNQKIPAGDKVVTLLTQAKKAGIKWPKLKIPVGADKSLVLYLCGPTSNNNGGVSIVNDKPYMSYEQIYYGKISPRGQTVLSKAATSDQQVMDSLTFILEDPVAFAKLYGKQTGCCVFCARELLNASSIYHGYGPVCAENYGLPWGEVPPDDSKLSNPLHNWEL